MDKAKLKVGIQKYTMIIVLLLVTLFFTWGTQGKILLPQNITNLISQNAYVFVLATGMLLCILTGGNIYLSVGSVVCFVGAVGGVMMEKMHLPVGIAIVLMLLLGAVIGAWQAFWIAFLRIPPFIVTLSACWYSVDFPTSCSAVRRFRSSQRHLSNCSAVVQTAMFRIFSAEETD